MKVYRKTCFNPSFYTRRSSPGRYRICLFPFELLFVCTVVEEGFELSS
jgi:hypothetical protein